jgi:hypothetical protein
MMIDALLATVGSNIVQLRGKPPTRFEIDVQLAHGVRSNLDAFVAENISLTLSTAGFTANIYNISTLALPTQPTQPSK